MLGNRRAVALLLAVVLLGAAFTSPALAQGGGGEGEENETEEAEQEDEERDDERGEDESEERKVQIETEGKNLKIELERETEPREDKVEMTWDAEEAAFGIEHETENETREMESKLEAVFGALAEYRDANDNGRYDAGEELVSGWVLGEEYEDDDDLGLAERGEWGTPEVSDVTRDGKDGKRITTSAQLGEQGELTLRLLVFGSFVDLNGTDLSPTGAKIDVVVQDYAFQGNGTDLALFLETETEHEFESEVDDDEETGVAAHDPANGTGARLVFTWKDTAQVDGETRDVATTVLEEEAESESEDGETSDERERAFVLSYPRGDEIVHDPRAEVVLASGAQADTPAPGLAALLASIGALAVAVGRRR